GSSVSSSNGKDERMAAQTCRNCGAALRPQSRFCPKCAAPVGAAPPAYQPPPGYTARTAGPPPVASPRPRPGAPARGTVVRVGATLLLCKAAKPNEAWLASRAGEQEPEPEPEPPQEPAPSAPVAPGDDADIAETLVTPAEAFREAEGFRE